MIYCQICEKDEYQAMIIETPVKFYFRDAVINFLEEAPICVFCLFDMYQNIMLKEAERNAN